MDTSSLVLHPRNTQVLYEKFQPTLNGQPALAFSTQRIAHQGTQVNGTLNNMSSNGSRLPSLPHADRSVVEVAGHLLKPSLYDVKSVFGFNTPIWMECKIVHVGVAESHQYVSIPVADEFSSNDGPQTLANLQDVKCQNILTTVSEQKINHVSVVSPFDHSQHITVSCNDSFFPGSLLFSTPFYGTKEALEALSCGDEVEVFETTPFPAWYPGLVQHKANIHGSPQAELQVLTLDIDHNFRFIHRLTSDVLWRLPTFPRLSFAEAGGIFSQILMYSPALHYKSDSEEIIQALNFVKEKTHLLKAQSLFTVKPYHIHFVGFHVDIQYAKRLFSELLKTQLTSSIEGRRQKRLQFLAARRDGYQNPRSLEFLIKDSYVGSVIGRRGKKLSQVAKEFQIELRVLPEENGFRRVRIYGKEIRDVNEAKEALEFVYQKILLSADGLHKIKSHISALRLMSQRASLLFCVLNEEEQMLIVCGVRCSLKIFRDRLRKFFSQNQPLPLQPPRELTEL